MLQSVLENLTDRAFLAQLWHDSNRYVASLNDRTLSRLLVWTMRNQEGIHHLEGSWSAATQLRDLISEPYPLDPDDAAAVEAAIEYEVRSLDELVTSDLPSWRSEDSATSAQGTIAGSPEEVVRDLIKAGELKGAAAVDLAPIPIEALIQAPVLEGQWIDHHLVELAEFGALAEERGLTSKVSSEGHALAPLQLCRDEEGKQPVTVEDAHITLLREEARAALAKFNGRTMQIDGRTYLHIDDFRSWTDRKLPGELKVQQAVLVRSWNDWVERQSAAGQAELFGISVGKLVPLAKCSDFIVCSDPNELRLRRRRRAVRLSEIRALLAKYAEAEVWNYGDDLAQVLQEVSEADAAISIIGERYFDRRQILFDEYRSRLKVQIAEALELARRYNHLVELRQELCGGPAKIDIGSIAQTAEARGTEVVDAMVAQIKWRLRAGIEARKRAEIVLKPIMDEIHYYFPK